MLPQREQFKIMIGILDYGMGNLKSVLNAFRRLGFYAEITSDADSLLNYDRIVLPGVGAFGTCLDNLKSSGLFEASKEFIDSGKPFLGICVGMQLLFQKSSEYGEHYGYGLFPGEVEKFDNKANKSIKIPHMGWNTLEIISGHPLLRDIEDGSYVYFVHSFYAPLADYTVTETEYAGIRFSSMTAKDNVTAVQFHPEKSQKVGLEILKNFGEWRC